MLSSSPQHKVDRQKNLVVCMRYNEQGRALTAYSTGVSLTRADVLSPSNTREITAAHATRVHLPKV